ncbi:MAG: hypothetical protein ILM98_14470, partial [Kiritimatiellae bacterium]|nr:hypothetical protein [Kiritimatiellia bacterium]
IAEDSRANVAMTLWRQQHRSGKPAASMPQLPLPIHGKTRPRITNPIPEYCKYCCIPVGILIQFFCRVFFYPCGF